MQYYGNLPYIPYMFRFKRGDVLYLKDGDELREAYEALKAEVQEENSWDDVDWL
jgi:hypothetical protein